MNERRNYCRYEIVSYTCCFNYLDYINSLDPLLIGTTKKYGIIGIIENKDGSIEKYICSGFSSIGIVIDFVLLMGDLYNKWGPLGLNEYDSLEVLYEFNTFEDLFKKYPELNY